MTIDEMIAVLQAHKAGKTVQFLDSRSNDETSWSDLTTGIFNFGLHDYRIKPEPREWWIHMYPNESCPTIHTRKEAEEILSNFPGKIFRVREVIEP